MDNENNSDDIQLNAKDIQEVINTKGMCTRRGVRCRHMAKFRCPRYLKAIKYMLDKYLKKHGPISPTQIQEAVDNWMNANFDVTASAKAETLPSSSPATADVIVN